jgi:hypothetical protein
MNATEWHVQDHKSALQRFVQGIEDAQAYAEATALIKALRIHGNQLIQPNSKALGDGLFELRGKQVRIFYVFRPGRRIVLLEGMIKKRSDIPSDVLRRLHRLNRQVA